MSVYRLTRRSLCIEALESRNLLSGQGFTEIALPNAEINSSVVHDSEILLQSEVETQIEIVPVLTAKASTTAMALELPETLNRYPIGETFYLEIWMKNVSPEASGISMGYVDITYDPEKISVQSLNHGSVYKTFPDGNVSAATGLIDDFGGGYLDSTNTYGSGSWVLLGSVTLTAVHSGTTDFVLAPGWDKISRLSAGSVEWSNVSLGTASVTLDEDVDNIWGVVSVSANPSSDVSQNLPESEKWIHEWQPYTMELWTNTYRDSYVTTLEFDPMQFTPADSSLIWETGESGLATLTVEITPESDWSLDSGYARIGMVQFNPTQKTDSSSVVGVAQSDVFIENAFSVNGKAVDTTVYAAPYDFDDNGKIDMTDFIDFAQRFNRTDAEALLADFDHNSVVQMDDFIIFAQNFNKSISDPKQTLTIIVPESASASVKQAAAIPSNEITLLAEFATAEPVTTPKETSLNVNGDSLEGEIPIIFPCQMADKKPKVRTQTETINSQTLSDPEEFNICLDAVSLATNSEDSAGLANPAKSETAGFLCDREIEPRVKRFSYDGERNGKFDMHDSSKFATDLNKKSMLESPIQSYFDGNGIVEILDDIALDITFNKRNSIRPSSANGKQPMIDGIEANNANGITLPLNQRPIDET